MTEEEKTSKHCSLGEGINAEVMNAKQYIYG